jgi:hypothetical protein
MRVRLGGGTCRPSRGPTTKKPIAAKPTGITSHLSKYFAIAPRFVAIQFNFSRQVTSFPGAMAAEVRQESIELEVPGLAAAAMTPDSPAFPLPPLRATGTSSKRTFWTVVLENPYLRALFLPELGGRLLSLLDKRTGTECLSREPLLSLREGGQRGFWIPEGLQWEIGEPFPRASMAEVDVQIVETEPGAPARAVFFQLVPGLELSWHLWASLPPDRAALELEWRALNRSLSELPYSSGLSSPISGELVESSAGRAVYDPERRAGVAVLGRTAFDRAEESEVGWRLSAAFPQSVLAPRQTDRTRFSILPLSGLSRVDAFSEAGALGLDGASLQIQSATPAKSKVFLLTADGQTLEAAADLKPSALLELEVPGSPQAAVLRAESGGEILRWPDNAVSEADSSQGRMAGRRHVPCLEAAHGALADEDWAAAREELEEALLFNGDDPLAWWLLAAIGRHEGAEDEPAELPNAHFLAPMEPVLRAEAFLAQPQTMVAEPSPLVERLAADPEQLAECACRLLEAGLRQDAARWLDEALRHRDLAALRDLAAWNLLALPAMRAEALMHAAQAAKLPPGPPHAWRPLQLRARQEVAEAFLPEKKA